MTAPVGRPTNYNPSICKDMLEYFQAGDWASCPTFEHYASKLGIPSSTLRLWKSKHPEFMATWERCKDIQMHTMFDGGMTGEFKTNFVMFALKNMHNWRDKIETEDKSEVQVIVNGAKREA